jgi:hypothetical protein
MFANFSFHQREMTMHGFEIVEHTMWKQDIRCSLVKESASIEKVRVAVFKYLRKKKKLLKFKAIRKLVKKIRKMIRRNAFSVNPIQTA